MLTNKNIGVYLLYSNKRQTVDVEIKTKDVLTESRGGWEPGSGSLLNGPQRAWSKDFYSPSIP